MPPAAILAGGAIAGGIGGALNQSAANKGPRAVFPGLQGQALGGLSSVAGPGFSQLLSLMQTGNPVDTGGLEQSLQANKTITDRSNIAMLKEQFGSSGLSASSPAAVGESNYLASSNANFLQTIANLRYQSATDATNREMAATEFGLSSFLGPAFTETGPKGSVLGAFLGGAGSGADTGASIASNLQILNLLKELGIGV